MTDPGIVDYLITEGYTFDGEDWIGKDSHGILTSAIEAERSKHESSPGFKGFEKAYKKLDDPKGWASSAGEVLKFARKKFEELKSLKDVDESDVDKILDSAWSEKFLPSEGYDKRYDKSKLDILEDKLKKEIKDDLDDDYVDLLTDLGISRDKLKDIKDFDIIEKIETDGFDIVSDTDKAIVDEILKGSIARKKGVLRKNLEKQHTARLLDKEDVAVTGINTTKQFAKLYGWDQKDPEELEKARTILKEKGITITDKDRLDFGKVDYERFLKDDDFMTFI